MKLKGKERRESKVYKIHDIAKTSCQELKEYCTLSEENIRWLEELYLSLNMADLKRKMSKLQDKLGKTLRYTLDVCGLMQRIPTTRVLLPFYVIQILDSRFKCN